MHRSRTQIATVYAPGALFTYEGGLGCCVSVATNQDEGPQRGSGRPIPPLVSKIQVTSTNAGARAQGGLTPDFLVLSDLAFVLKSDGATPL